MTPCSCAAARAPAICFAIASASLIGTGPRAYPLRKVFSFDELHDEGTGTVGFLEAVDAADVRVIEGCEHFRFPLESCEAIGIVGERLRQDLDRDVASQLRIAGPIHFAHAARAEGRDDFVRTYANAGSESWARLPVSRHCWRRSFQDAFVRGVPRQQRLNFTTECLVVTCRGG